VADRRRHLTAHEWRESRSDVSRAGRRIEIDPEVVLSLDGRLNALTGNREHLFIDSRVAVP
jgi:hypothetical protein